MSRAQSRGMYDPCMRIARLSEHKLHVASQPLTMSPSPMSVAHALLLHVITLLLPRR